MKKILEVLKWLVFIIILVSLAVLVSALYIIRGTEMGLWTH